MAASRFALLCKHLERVRPLANGSDKLSLQPTFIFWEMIEQ